MERVIDQVNIPKEARLSVELRIGTEGSSIRCEEARSEETAGESEQSASKDTSAMLASQASDVPMRQKNPPTVPKLQGTTQPLPTEIWSIVSNELTQQTGDHPPTEPNSTPSNQPDDCLLLDYQNHLFLLEDMNRRASQRTKKPRR